MTSWLSLRSQTDKFSGPGGKGVRGVESPFVETSGDSRMILRL